MIRILPASSLEAAVSRPISRKGGSVHDRPPRSSGASVDRVCRRRRVPSVSGDLFTDGRRLRQSRQAAPQEIELDLLKDVVQNRSPGHITTMAAIVFPAIRPRDLLTMNRRNFPLFNRSWPECGRLCSISLLGLIAGLFAGDVRAQDVPIGLSSTTGRSLKTLVTPATQKSIDAGFQWIQRSIRRDGTIGTDAYQPPDLSCTAIVGLALLAEGSTPNSGRYVKESRQILYGIYELVEYRLSVPYRPERSSLVQRKIGANADLFLATLYLAQVYGEAPGEAENIRQLLDQLVDRICRTQQEDGTWGAESWAPVLGTVLGWECLRTASSAGLQINASADTAGDALLKSLRKHTEQDAKSWMHRFYKDASSLRVLYSLHYRDDSLFQESVQRLLTTARTDRRPFQLAGGEEFLAFHLVTECLIKEARPDWETWYPNVRDNLIRQQNRDGSWTGHHCITDRTFCTAAAIMTLLAPNQCLPISDL